MNATSKTITPIHLLLRIRAADRDRVTDHWAVIQKQGSALLGKVGRTMSLPLQREANEQIAIGLPTYLFLATREGADGPYLMFRCALRQVYSHLPEAKRGLVPAYYGPLVEQVNTWFEIGSLERMASSEMDSLTVFTSGRKIADALKSSMISCRVVIAP